uniref:TOG domain-containing protein n=3 Tax=Parascaris univalens TaxID=6257 RepID=A0A914ZKU7_PARUN
MKFRAEGSDELMDEWSLMNEVDVLPKLPAQFSEWLESKKWTERRDALQALLDELAKSPRLDPKANYGELTSTLRNVLSKDANINVCALCAKCIAGIANGLRAKFAPFASMYVPVIFERFKEKKPTLRDPLIECIDAVATTVNLDTLVEDFTSSMDKPNPNIKLQACHFIYRIMKKHSQNTAPKKLIKGVVPLIIKFSTDSDAEVRDAACGAIGSMMRLTGEKVMNTFIGSLQDDKTKMKKITDARDQAVAEAAEEEAKRATSSVEVASASASDAGGGAPSTGSHVVAAPAAAEPEIDPWDMLDPVDVISKLPDSFKEGVESKKWIERRDALQTLLTLCTDNPKLDPKASYGEHVAILKKILEKDANINVCAVAARCLTAFASGLRKKFAPHAAVVTPVIFEKFKEKKPVLRDPLIDCIDAVAASTTLETMAEDIQIALEKPNPNIKIQTNLFLYRVFKKHNAQTMPKKVLKAFAPIIVKHTGDSDPEVRDASYAALGAAMKAVGEKACMVLISDIAEDKMKMSKIKDFCEKAIQEAGPDVVSVMVQSMHKSNQPNSKTANGSADATSDAPLRPPAPGVGSKTTGKPPVKKVTPEEEEEDSEKQHAKGSGKEAAALKESEEPPRAKDEMFITNKEKAVRLRDEKNLKLLKWNFDVPTSEHVEQLRTLLSGVTQANVFAMMFNKDFKMHLKAIDVMQTVLSDNSESILANCDLILKWISLRFFETNPTVLLKVLDLALAIFTAIRDKSEPFSDAEMNAFLPYLIMKMGEPKDSVRTPVRSIMHVITEIMGPTKVFPFVLDGLKTKNSRQRTECLQVLEELLDTTGMAATTTPGPSLKQIAACIGDRDNNVRNAAINAVVVAWKEEGDRVFQLIGKMSDKDKAMLDERIKRSGAVQKARGGPERAPGASSQQGRGRPSIGTGVKGGRMRTGTPRSMSRTGRSATSSRAGSPEQGANGLNDTYKSGDPNDTAAMQEGGKTRRFALDMTILSFDNDESLPKSELVEENLDVLQPFEPPVRQRLQPVPTPRRTESVSSITSLESSAGEVDKVVHSVASVSQATASTAIGQLQYLLTDQGTFRFVADRADAVVQAIVTQTSLIRSRHLNDVNALDEVNELVRTICHFLSSLVKEPGTCSRISSEPLKMLIQEFLYLLKDERMKRLKDIESIYRSLNYLTIRICDNADPTACFTALCSMLKSALYDPRNQTVDLINKCIYKQSELFVREGPLDLDVIVKAVHDFMHEFRSRVDDCDAVKNSVHAMELCVQRLVAGARSSVLDHLSLIPNPETSEAVSYMRKCVRGLQNKSNQSSLASSAYGDLPGQVPSANFDETVKRLVAKIVDEPAGPGVRRLHTFLRDNPDARKYLDDALKKHEHHSEFIVYQLKKMDRNERETPEMSSEYTKMHEFARQVLSELKSYQQVGVWPSEATTAPQQVVAVDAIKTTLRRSFQPERSAAVEGAPENEPSVQSTPHKRNLTASDVEPLKQRLLNMRRQRQMD